MDSLNPGIKKTVAWLRELGYETCDSGDGKTKDFGCDRPHAYVSIKTTGARLVSGAHALLIQLRKAGVTVGKLGPDGLGVYINASYDPCSGIGIVDLVGLDDEGLFGKN